MCTSLVEQRLQNALTSERNGLLLAQDRMAERQDGDAFTHHMHVLEFVLTRPLCLCPLPNTLQQDRVAEHQDGDAFTHHVHAPLVEAAAELTAMDFDAAKPRRESLDKALDCKVCVPGYCTANTLLLGRDAAKQPHASLGKALDCKASVCVLFCFACSSRAPVQDCVAKGSFCKERAGPCCIA